MRRILVRIGIVTCLPAIAIADLGVWIWTGELALLDWLMEFGE